MDIGLLATWNFSILGNVESSLWHRKVCVSVCSLNQWALDFEGNRKRILKSKLFNFVMKLYFGKALTAH